MGTVFCSHRSSKRSSPLLSFSSVVWPLGYMAVRLVWKLQRMLLAESTENLLLEMPEGLDRLRMTSFIAEPSIPSREQPRKEAEKEAKGNLIKPGFSHSTLHHVASGVGYGIGGGIVRGIGGIFSGQIKIRLHSYDSVYNMIMIMNIIYLYNII